jgi:hypothetical protein
VTQTEVEEVRDLLRELVDWGFVQWGDPARSLDEYGRSERLPIVAALPVVEVTKEEVNELLAYFDVTAETTGRLVKLSPRSTASCPLHHLLLRPDVCRSCHFLAP